jgi:hypothetical protein
MAKVYTVTVRNRAAGIALGVVILGVGAVLLTVGFALLAGLMIAGGVLGTGYAIYRRVRGTHQTLPPSRARGSDLDPQLEVKPTRAAVVRPLPRNGDAGGDGAPPDGAR